MATPAANSTAKFCRQLFQDAAPRVVVQQALDQVIRADQERFRAKWNFDVTKGFSAAWKVVQEPKATFYTRAPRRLKARRRLNHSMVGATQEETATPTRDPLSESSLIGSLVFNFSRTKKEKNKPVPSSSTDSGSLSVSQTPTNIKYAPCSSSSPTSLLNAGPVFKLPSPVSKLLKRKSNPRMTDFFAVQKRARNSHE